MKPATWSAVPASVMRNARTQGDRWHAGISIRALSTWMRCGPHRRGTEMTSYASQAEHLWRTAAPTAYAQLGDQADRTTFFQSLGAEAERLVGEMTSQIAGVDLPGETYLEKVGRLNAAKSQAEEIARAQVLMPPTIEDEPIDLEDREAERRWAESERAKHEGESETDRAQAELEAEAEYARSRLQQ